MRFRALLGQWRFQFLGIPPKGELLKEDLNRAHERVVFPISRDPPEGGTAEFV